jgi:hypothetical protein
MKVDIHLTTGQMLAEVASRLPPNTQIKITPRMVRVQHTSHCDYLTSPSQIDQALSLNTLLKQ